MSGMGDNTVCCEEALERGQAWHYDELEDCWDDVTGVALNPQEVKKARDTELSYFEGKGVGDLAPIEQCWQRTGKAPVTVRWIDHNKGDATHMDYRSRLVARQFRDGEEAIFAATPPLEILKLILSLAVSGYQSESGGILKIGILDVSRAFFNADITELTYVDLPGELKDKYPGMCWK